VNFKIVWIVYWLSYKNVCFLSTLDHDDSSESLVNQVFVLFVIVKQSINDCLINFNRLLSVYWKNKSRKSNDSISFGKEKSNKTQRFFIYLKNDQLGLDMIVFNLKKIQLIQQLNRSMKRYGLIS